MVSKVVLFSEKYSAISFFKLHLIIYIKIFQHNIGHKLAIQAKNYIKNYQGFKKRFKNVLMFGMFLIRF